MRLGQAWDELPDDLGDARIRVLLEEPERADRAAQLLGPLQPYRAAPNALSFRVVGHGEGVRRLLERLDEERIHGVLEVLSSDPVAERDLGRAAPTLREQWQSELATLPADWLDRASVNMVPINPRRDRSRLAFRFRCARSFGYGGSPGMVARCLARCDEDGIRGTVRVVHALSDTRPVYTQGPVWQMDGRTV